MATKANTNETVADQAIEVETPNTPDLVSLGKDAINALNSGNEQLGKANAIFMYVLAQAYMTKVFKTTIKYKDAPEEHSFDLEDIVNKAGINKTDGKKDNIKSKARLDHVAKELFGCEKEFTVSQRNMFMDCLTVIKHIVDLDYEIDTEIDLTPETRNLIVPYELCVPKPDAKQEAKLKEYKHNTGSEFILDGSDRLHTYAQLKRMVTPVATPRQPNSGTGKSDEPIILTSSIEFLADALKALNDASGDIKHNYAALNNDATDKLFQLHIQLGKYFKSNPVQTKETGNKPKAA